MTITLQKLYIDYRGQEKNAGALLQQMNWFFRVAEFDPKTGMALPQALSGFLAKVAQPANDHVVLDRLWRIIEHSRISVGRLFRTLNESPRREQALLQVHAVRELDANSFIKLSNRPGRTIREKLAGKPYMQAVRRFQSIDLPENRLLKAFALHISELLELRRECLGHEDELLPIIQSWLRSEEVRAIGKWDNLPPNNTLLSHRDYRRIWDAWRWLQSLDEDIISDVAQFEARNKVIHSWKQYAQMWSDGGHLFAEMPILFDYENFEILSWSLKQPLFTPQQSISRYIQKYEINKPVCVDLTSLYPRYSSDNLRPQSLPDAFLWQQWRRDDTCVDIELFHSDAVWLHPQATTVSAPDLFFVKDNAAEHSDQVARAFAVRLRETFKNETLIWLTPDFLNDFELEVIRRNLNARFSDAEPLPRSVAAVFSQVDPAKITGEGYAVLVVDSIGGTTTATKVVAKFDKELADRLPITEGFYWERCPPVIIPCDVDGERSGDNGYGIPVVDTQEHWHDVTRLTKSSFIEAADLKQNPDIGHFAFCINLRESPVVGGVRLYALQQQAGDIPLWRDQIPELSIKVMKATYQRFYLVSRGTTVKPVRGKPVVISIDESFTLPSGKEFYQFPLYIGDKADDLGFSARLDSPAFPLKKDVSCKLNLTFEYGADEPYKLIFEPKDESFPPIYTTWQRTVEIIITDAPAPEYPRPKTWAELRSFPKPGRNNETSDLFDWVRSALARLDRAFYIRPKLRTTGVITQKWRTDKKGGHFTFATCDSNEASIFIHQNNFAREFSYADFSEGRKISFELQECDGKCSGLNVAVPEYKDEVRLKTFDKIAEKSLSRDIQKKLFFPMAQIWQDGRSLKDPECPKDFADFIRKDFAWFASLSMESAIPGSVKGEIKFVLACLHKDLPDCCVPWMLEQVWSNNKVHNKRVVGLALGDVSEQWQKDLFSKLVANPTTDALRVFSYAIWREHAFVEKFCLADLLSILNTLQGMLVKIQHCPPSKSKWDIPKWKRKTTEPLELLLGLLRTRASSNPEIRMLLQPHQKITKELAKQIERVTEIVAESNVILFSRVQISIDKPEGDKTPDLLYALRLYLTGDDGVNAIHISSVSDDESDDE